MTIVHRPDVVEYLLSDFGKPKIQSLRAFWSLSGVEGGQKKIPSVAEGDFNALFSK